MYGRLARSNVARDCRTAGWPISHALLPAAGDGPLLRNTRWPGRCPERTAGIFLGAFHGPTTQAGNDAGWLVVRRDDLHPRRYTRYRLPVDGFARDPPPPDSSHSHASRHSPLHRFSRPDQPCGKNGAEVLSSWRLKTLIVAALYQGVNELQVRPHSPPYEGGVAVPSRKRTRSEMARTGWSLTSDVAECVLKHGA